MLVHKHLSKHLQLQVIIQQSKTIKIFAATVATFPFNTDDDDDDDNSNEDGDDAFVDDDDGDDDDESTDGLAR